MATNNERATRKAIVAAFGGTGNTANETVFNKSLIAAISGSNVKTKPSVVALVALTNSTGGTANDTVQAVPQAVAATDVTAAGLTSTNAALTIVNNDIADLTAKLNAVIAALKA